MATTTLLATVYIAIKEPAFSQYIKEYLYGKKGIHDAVQCHTLQSLLQNSLTTTNKILVLGTGFQCICSIADTKNVVQQVNANTNILFCSDSDHELLRQLLKLNYKGIYSKPPAAIL